MDLKLFYCGNLCWNNRSIKLQHRWSSLVKGGEGVAKLSRWAFLLALSLLLCIWLGNQIRWRAPECLLLKLGWRGVGSSRIWNGFLYSASPGLRCQRVEDISCLLRAYCVPAIMLVSEEKNLLREEKLILWLVRITWGIVRQLERMLTCTCWRVHLRGRHQATPSPWVIHSPCLLRAGYAWGWGPPSVQICPCGFHSSTSRETVALTSKFLGPPPFAPNHCPYPFWVIV